MRTTVIYIHIYTEFFFIAMVIYIQTQMFHIYMAMGANFDTFPDAWQRFGAVLRLLLPN
jgi:hypothetical protein